MRNVLEFIHNELQHNRAVVSTVIVASSGSTPRSAGSRMAVAVHGSTQGSVGGGPSEALAQREAHRAHQAGVSKLLKLDLTGKVAAESGMICGSEQEILVEYIPAHESNQELFSMLSAAERNERPSTSPCAPKACLKADSMLYIAPLGCLLGRIHRKKLR